MLVINPQGGYRMPYPQAHLTKHLIILWTHFSEMLHPNVILHVFFLLTLDTLSLRKHMRWEQWRELKDNKSGEWRKLAESFNTPACKTNQLKCYSISSHRSREDSLISVWKTDHWGRYHVNVVIISTTHNHVNNMWWWHVDSDYEQLLVLIKLWTLNH